MQLSYRLAGLAPECSSKKSKLHGDGDRSSGLWDPPEKWCDGVLCTRGKLNLVKCQKSFPASPQITLLVHADRFQPSTEHHNTSSRESVNLKIRYMRYISGVTSFYQMSRYWAWCWAGVDMGLLQSGAHRATLITIGNVDIRLIDANNGLDQHQQTLRLSSHR